MKYLNIRGILKVYYFYTYIIIHLFFYTYYFLHIIKKYILKNNQFINENVLKLFKVISHNMNKKFNII